MNWQIKKSLKGGLIVIVGIFLVCVFVFPQHSNQLALVATFIVLVWYAYDTNRIANQTVETNLRPIVLRSGLNIAWNFRHIKDDGSNRSTFLEIENLKNIAMNIEGWIILDRKQYKLLFGRESSGNEPENESKKIAFVDSYKWQWLPSGGKIFASFDSGKFINTSSENEIYLNYKDVEGNSYFTKEDHNYLQVTGIL
jgi:hypothetical protein